MKILYWCSKPGYFVNKKNGLKIEGHFTGSVYEWYETLIETMIDLNDEKLDHCGPFWMSPLLFEKYLSHSVFFKGLKDNEPKDAIFEHFDVYFDDDIAIDTIVGKNNSVIRVFG